MSINLSIYDLFANTLPGFLHLFIVWQFAQFTKVQLPKIDLGNTAITLSDSLILFLMLSGVAFVIGAIMNYPAQEFWYRFAPRKSIQKKALDVIKERHPEYEISFREVDWSIIHSLMYKDRPELAMLIERDKAFAIMLINISFGLILLGLVYLLGIIYWDFSIRAFELTFIIPATLSWILAYFAGKQARKFYEWFYLGIYEVALSYEFRPSDYIKPISKTKTLSSQIDPSTRQEPKSTN